MSKHIDFGYCILLQPLGIGWSALFSFMESTWYGLDLV